VGDGVPSVTQPIRAYSESSSTLQLIASEAVAQFVGMNLILALAVAALVGLAAGWMAYIYCDDWRWFAIGQLRRARALVKARIGRTVPPVPSA
jgi:hypothetical protein